MTTRYPETISTADLASAANRPPTNGEENRPMPNTQAGSESPGPLLAEDFTRECHTRWDNVQAGFVDEPRSAVKKADELVAECMQKLADSFSNERTRLEQQWDRGDNVSTEDLRVALQKYRTFFNRLLSV